MFSVPCQKGKVCRIESKIRKWPSYDSIVLLKIQSASSARAACCFQNTLYRTFFSILWRNQPARRAKTEFCCLSPPGSPLPLTLPIFTPPLPGLPCAKGPGLVVVRPLAHDREIIHAVEYDERELRQVDLMDLHEDLLPRAWIRRRLFLVVEGIQRLVAEAGSSRIAPRQNCLCFFAVHESGSGRSCHFAATQQFSRFRSEADMQRAALAEPDE